MAKQYWCDLDLINATKIINLVDPTDPQDAATKIYVDNAIEGLDSKESVEVASVGNVDISSAPASIDGVTLTNGDRVLLKDQTNPEENGIYIFDTAGNPLVRSADANTFEELEQAVVNVKQGTSANITYRQTEIDGILDTDNITWIQFGTSVPDATETTKGKAEIATQAETDAGLDDTRFITPLKLANYADGLKKYTTLIGDGAATSYTVTHGLNTRQVQVEIYRNSGDYDTVQACVGRPSLNTVELQFSVAPTSNQFEVVVIG